MFRACSTVVSILLVFGVPTAKAQSLEASERAELRRYLADLKAGKPGSAAQVERLAGLSFAMLVEVMEAYAALPESAEPHTHRAFHVLLERTSREALSPWPMVQLYSAELADFLTRPAEKSSLSEKLFRQLLRSDGGRQVFDLAVRLTPEVSLRHLAAREAPGRVELFDAWNRRLARGRERRPIHALDQRLDTIATSYAADLPTAEGEPHLRFLASWPTLRDPYRTALRKGLESEDPERVRVALAVQQRVPAWLDLNEGIVARFPQDDKLVEQALRNYAVDEKHDHAATLRRLWPQLPATRTKPRYACLYAMGVHPRGNDAIALAAVREQAFDFTDVAMPVLRRGDRAKATRAVRFILDTQRGHEEALRLARDLKLEGFEEDALRIALDGNREQIARQTALLYLQRADGTKRRRVLPYLNHPKADLRLTAIRTFAVADRLTEDDRNEIGPALIRVAQSDPSMGHRQEAIYALGCWRVRLAREFFRKVLDDNRPLILGAGQYNNDERYWQYRFRLMGLLGLVKLGDADARAELLDLHAKGGPTERMDVLLAFLDLEEVPEAAFADLTAPEPKLVATAARLIADHGDEVAKTRMRKQFHGSPLWREFLDSGIDDHNILGLVGLSADD